MYDSKIFSGLMSFGLKATQIRGGKDKSIVGPEFTSLIAWHKDILTFIIYVTLNNVT